MNDVVTNSYSSTRIFEIKKELTSQTAATENGENNKNSLSQDNVIIMKRKTDVKIDKSTKKRRTRVVLQEYSSCSDEEEYSLVVSNLPDNWTYLQIKNYIDSQCGPVDEIEMLQQGDSLNCAIRLTFPTSEECNATMNKLNDKEVEGKKLVLEMSGTFHEDDNQKSIVEDEWSGASDIGDNEPTESSQTQDDNWDVPPEDLFRLKPKFLKSLGIKPPLDKWVHVANFRCDKAELRDVMELAGHVLMCTVIKVAHKYAKVMYSHPLEAVQAVSMLDGQMYYGQRLSVTMDRNPTDVFITPKGLPNIGPGLGLYGRPIRNVSKHYNNYLRRQTSSINPVLFDLNNDKDLIKDETKVSNDDDINDYIESMKTDKKSFKIKNVEELQSDAKPASSVSDAPVSPKPIPKPDKPQVVIAQGAQSVKMYTLPIRLTQPKAVRGSVPRFYQSAASRPANPRQFEPPPVPYVPQYGPQVAPMYRPGPVNVAHQSPMHNVVNPGPMIQQGSTTLHFSNLPPTTTLPMLCEKMSSCGQVVSVQLTTPGRAVVSFGHRAHAERCFQSFNGLNAEGYIISVNFA